MAEGLGVYLKGVAGAIKQSYWESCNSRNYHSTVGIRKQFLIQHRHMRKNYRFSLRINVWWVYTVGHISRLTRATGGM